jgi:hypothetical protein
MRNFSFRLLTSVSMGTSNETKRNHHISYLRLNEFRRCKHRNVGSWTLYKWELCIRNGNMHLRLLELVFEGSFDTANGIAVFRIYNWWNFAAVGLETCPARLLVTITTHIAKGNFRCWLLTSVLVVIPTILDNYISCLQLLKLCWFRCRNASCWT